MNYLQKIFRSFEFLEKILPKKLRLPNRYFMQKTLSALEPEFKALDLLVPNNMNSIDIGANKGIYSYVLSKKSSHVYCFEPLQECCEYIENFGSDDISVINCALSDVDSNLELFIPIQGFRSVLTRASLDKPDGAFSARNVPVRKLDDYAYQNIGFIKIDVEGVELLVLKGGEHTIMNTKPNLLVEINMSSHSEESFINVFNFLYKLNYKAYVYKESKLLLCIGKEKEFGTTFYNFIFMCDDK